MTKHINAFEFKNNVCDLIKTSENHFKQEVLFAHNKNIQCCDD
jgi:hypothetical protein